MQEQNELNPQFNITFLIPAGSMGPSEQFKEFFETTEGITLQEQRNPGGRKGNSRGMAEFVPFATTIIEGVLPFALDGLKTLIVNYFGQQENVRSIKVTLEIPGGEAEVEFKSAKTIEADLAKLRKQLGVV